MYNGFRTYELAVKLYKECKKAQLPSFLKDQLLRASSSICLNLAEGSAKATRRDRAKFYFISFASCREAQSIVDLEQDKLNFLATQTDILGAHLYKLCKNT